MSEFSLQRYMIRHPQMTKAVGLGLLAVVVVLIATVPIFGRSTELLKQIEVRGAEEEKLLRQVSVLSQVDPVALEERVKLLDSALPVRKDVILYLATIDGLSRELGLNFSGIALNPGDVTEASESAKSTKKDVVTGVHSLETEIQISGSKDSVFGFLKALERSLPLMMVKDVKVSIMGPDAYLLSVRLGMLWAGTSIADIKGTIALFDEKEEGYFQELLSYKRFSSAALEGRVVDEGLGKDNLFAPVEIGITPQPTETPEFLQ